MALLALVVALVATAGPASAATGSIQIGSGKLVARGAAVDVPVTITFTCDEGFSSGAIEFYLSQAQGRTVVSGQGYAQVPSCTGEPQTVTVRVGAWPGPFRGGSALASATLLQCRVEDGWGLVCYYTGISTQQVIMITG